MELSGQQWILKGITINGANVGIKAGGFQLVCLDCNLSNGATGIDASGISGSLTVIDSSGNSLGNMIVSSNAGGSAQNSIILENVQCTNSGSTVSLNNNAVLSGSVTNTWVHGNLVSQSSPGFSPVRSYDVSTPEEQPPLHMSKARKSPHLVRMFFSGPIPSTLPWHRPHTLSTLPTSSSISRLSVVFLSWEMAPPTTRRTSTPSWPSMLDARLFTSLPVRTS